MYRGTTHVRKNPIYDFIDYLQYICTYNWPKLILDTWIYSWLNIRKSISPSSSSYDGGGGDDDDEFRFNTIIFNH